MAKTKLKFPAPAIGGKARVAAEVWKRFGDCDNYIEPFVFSGAVLLARPSPPRIETINDINCDVSNFFRAVKADPDAVAASADWPVNECDLRARHMWLVLSPEARAFREKMRADPDYYDAKRAGWWCWGACCWIGGGWCQEPAEGDSPSIADQVPTMEQCQTGGKGVNSVVDKRPHLGSAQNDHGRRAHQGTGVHAKGTTAAWESRPALHGNHDAGGIGVHNENMAGAFVADNRPQLADAFARGRGVHGNDRAETCAQRRAWLEDWMRRLADRMRVVRVCCGHWLRVCDSHSVTTRLGVTGVFMDPPYPTHGIDGKKSRTKGLYASDGSRDELDKLRDEVLAYCIERGPDPKMRICVAGLDTDGYAALEHLGWKVYSWTSSGYQNRHASGKANAKRERLWFSPHCRNPETEVMPLFARIKEMP